MEFCSECGSQMIHTDNGALCPCCGYADCDCADCVAKATIDEYWELVDDTGSEKITSGRP